MATMQEWKAVVKRTSQESGQRTRALGWLLMRAGWRLFAAGHLGQGLSAFSVGLGAFTGLGGWLRRRRTPRHSCAPARPLWRAKLVGVVGVAVGLGGLLCGPDSTPPRLELVQAVEEDEEVPAFFSAGQDAGVVSKPMPKKRMRGQQAPPCLPPPGNQVELNDACWAGVKVPPPCDSFYEHAGECYAPIIEKKKLPTSVEP